MDLWVIGGRQRDSFRAKPEWESFECAVAAKISNGRPEAVLEYTSPPEHCPDVKPSVVFKAATIVGDIAYLCTQTEVLICDFPSFKIKQVISLPCFNDVHHVVPSPEETLLVTVTGLDAVAEVTPEGELLRLTDVLGGDVWERFSKDVDYRKVPTTKPHASHPNYTFFLKGKPWATRLHQQDAACLSDTQQTISLHTMAVHDGHVEDNRILFTGVDGHVIEVDCATQTKKVFDLNELSTTPNRPLGWCRGILPTNEGVWVGFSRLRATKLRQNLSWVKRGFQNFTNLPTRITLYDLDDFSIKDEVDIESAGVNAVFSIHDANSRPPW